ncbi:Sua5/YciO/YrdC/YwlC family protein [Candidatus Marinimicrobia bacterium]|nr:Sua5/YciO/YrdC/YwlC family protein [Candidatus Neomarinimicrobiota bacterium]MDB3887515.1 Sua5/YciO/YrdC/YwlC family protein [Candidatus Neomarinimicrobiota bacterium]MDC1145894.1 Sua5/YciO/YrdC/YwlC family protein [Candidatus Neomarinimicrobiota bacterium]|tara:strand:- start:527 stop:1093 length:567 start_codon:yes stop_codon:yes gene_type:complete
MKRISIDHPGAISATLIALRENKIIAYPTDTIYGIGTDIDNDKGINKINTLKGRKTPMSVLVHNFHSISSKLNLYPKLESQMNMIINNGDTCIVDYKSNAFNSLITQNNKVGFRVPNYPFLINLLEQYTKPITTTSINVTGSKPLNDPNKIEEIFSEDIDLLLDAGMISNQSASKIYMFEQNNITQIR